MEKIAEFEKYWKRAIVILANYNTGTFPVFGYQEVQSRYLVWCISGKGKIEVNGRSCRMFPGKTLFIPWNHHITYMPDPQNLFRLGCIHVIPDIEDCADEPLAYTPFHKREPLQKQYYLRHDEYLPGFEEVVEMELQLDHPLLRLGSYIIDRFQVSCPQSMLRAFPQMLLYEIFRIRSAGKSAAVVSDAMVEPMQKMVNLCFRMVEDDINMDVLVNNSSCSPATIYRLFKKHTGMSPGKFIMTLRLEHATRMLKLSSLSINEISARLHFKSPFYFSKCFKDRFGISPRSFRNSKSTVIVEPDKRLWLTVGEVIVPKKYHYEFTERMLADNGKNLLP